MTYTANFEGNIIDLPDYSFNIVCSQNNELKIN